MKTGQKPKSVIEHLLPTSKVISVTVNTFTPLRDKTINPILVEGFRLSSRAMMTRCDFHIFGDLK